MSIDEDVLPKIIRNLAETSDYRNRRAEINLTNRQSKRTKREDRPHTCKVRYLVHRSFLNQAGALLNVYKDGSVS